MFWNFLRLLSSFMFFCTERILFAGDYLLRCNFLLQISSFLFQVYRRQKIYKNIKVLRIHILADVINGILSRTKTLLWKNIDFDPKTLIKLSKLGLTEKSFTLVSLFCCYVILLTLHLFEWQKTFMSILLGFISPRTSIIELTCTTHLWRDRSI